MKSSKAATNGMACSHILIEKTFRWIFIPDAKGPQPFHSKGLGAFAGFALIRYCADQQGLYQA
ncbi:hypothetical protein [Paenibacillus stellifer]|uniref:hypothetical protein n=1 Tax=Paenibacillus stellifer TaxID=169760 RepID=UPI0012ED6234|nr:hypothetical protein [Paenibacillus stellifer]